MDIRSHRRDRHEGLRALARTAQSRALAPDARRARLGAPSPFEADVRQRAARAVLRSAGVLALALLTPTFAHAVARSDAARACVARVVEHVVSSESGGRVVVGELDYLDGERLVGRDVRIVDAAGQTWLHVDALELEYDPVALLAGRLVSTRGRAKGGSLTAARADAHDRGADARSDIVRLEHLETVDVAIADAASTERALVRARIAQDGAVVVDATSL